MPSQLSVGSSHHPYSGQLPEVGQFILIPEDALVDEAAKGQVKVREIVWHYNAAASALWPEIVCER
jgi:hypothetical protein